MKLKYADGHFTSGDMVEVDEFMNSSEIGVGEIIGGVSLINSLFGGGGGGGGGDQTITNMPPPFMIPYLAGDLNYRPDMQMPTSADFAHWAYMMQQGVPIGPAPPMMVNSPQYTGEGVHAAPFNYAPARLTGPAYGDQGPHGARAQGLIGPNGLLNTDGRYPSERTPNDGLLRQPNTPPPTPEPAAPALSAADTYKLMDWANRNRAIRDTGEDGAPHLSDLHRAINSGGSGGPGLGVSSSGLDAIRGMTFDEFYDLLGLNSALY